MSWFYTLANGPCLLSSNGSELIGIKNYYRSIYIRYHLHATRTRTSYYRAYVLRFLYEWRWSMAETNIYSIEGELRWWFSACMPLWTERIDAQYTYHKWKLGVIFFQLPAHNNQPLDYPTQSAWGYMLKLYNEWEIWQGALLQCGRADHTSHNNQPYSNAIREVRWDERSLMDNWD